MQLLSITDRLKCDFILYFDALNSLSELPDPKWRGYEFGKIGFGRHVVYGILDFVIPTADLEFGAPKTPGRAFQVNFKLLANRSCCMSM